MSIDMNYDEIDPTTVLATTTSDTNPTLTTDKTHLPITVETNSMTMDNTKPSKPTRIRATPKFLEDYTK